MESTAKVIDLFDEEKEKRRRKPMCLARIDNPECRNFIAPYQVVGPGVHTIRCYEDQVPGLEAMVETNIAGIEAAAQALRLNLAEEVADQLDGWRGTAEELAAIIETGDDDRVSDVYAKVLAETGHSLQGEFQRIYKRPMLPLRSVEVIKRGIDEPQALLDEDAVSRQMAIIKQALGGDDNKALADLVTEQAAALEALREEVAALRGKKKV